MMSAIRGIEFPIQKTFNRIVLFAFFAAFFALPAYPQEKADSPVVESKPDAPAGGSDVTAADGTSTEAESGSGTEPNADAAKKKEPEAVPPFAVQPYLINVSISFQNGCLPESEHRAGIIADIQKAVRRMYGRTWKADVVESSWLQPGSRRRLTQLQLPDVFDRYPEVKVHKAFFVTIETHGSGFEICCREYDARVHELTPVYSRQTYDARSIGSISAELLRDAFRPCVLFTRNFENEDGRPLMELQVQAGEIPPPDPSAEQVVEGDILRPFIRQMDRREPTKLKQLRAMTLSYIKVLEVDREIARGKVNGFYLTHMSFSPFGGKGRRMQHLALRQRPTAQSSRVRLVLRSRPEKPLISHRLALAYQLHWKDEEDGAQTQLVSDRNGEVVIESRENHPTFWIRVYSGASLLARVPYAPGLIPFDTVELPDDSVRLEVEGEIQLLSDDLIDAIALRGVLVARAKKAAKAGDTDQVATLFERYEAVPAKDYFLEQVSNIRISAVQKATDMRMRTSRIEKLCRGLSDSVETFFSDEKRSARLEELQQIRADAERNKQ